MFITFYSFKGGVGRTLALANVATLLAKDADEPCRVLVWDFDLAAPGLQQVVGCSWEGDKLGFVDYVLKYVQTATLPDIREHIHRTSVSGLDVLPAGYLDRSYAKKLDQIRWREIYRRARGFDFIEATKKQLATINPPYDYVLIDSLTGYSDVGGICVRQLPDAVVLVFRLNRQNLSGISRVYKSIKNAADDGRKVTQVIPVISPAWPFAAPDANAWVKRARRLFKDMKLLEVSFEGGLTFGEKVISREKRPYAMTSKVVGDYRRLASQIRRLNPQDARTILRSVEDLMIDRPEQALDSCINLVVRRPQKQEYWEKLVSAMFRLSAMEKPTAEKGKHVISKGCEADNPFAFLAQAKLRRGRDSLGAAFDDLSKVIQLAPQLTEPYLLRAGNSIERKDYPSALGDLSKFLAMRPVGSQLAIGYVNRAECFMNLGRVTEAISDLSEALRLQPRDVRLLRDRARALFMADRYEEAIADISQALEVAGPSQPVEILETLRAHLLFAARRKEEGTQTLQSLEGRASDVGDRLNVAEAYLTADVGQALRILNSIKEPGEKAVIFSALRQIAQVLLGTETAKEISVAAEAIGPEAKESSWSWFEIRQFLRWGLKQNIITEEKRDGIAQLIDKLERWAPPEGLTFSFLSDTHTWRLERLRLEPRMLRIGGAIHVHSPRE